MSSELQIIIRRQAKGRDATPWLEAQRERFAEAAHKCKEAFKDSKLKGAAKVRVMNQFISQELRK